MGFSDDLCGGEQGESGEWKRIESETDNDNAVGVSSELCADVRLVFDRILDSGELSQPHQGTSQPIQHLNKSGCYRDIIFANRDNVHQKDLCWMERTPDAGFENDKPQAPSEEFPSQEVGPDGKLRDI